MKITGMKMAMTASVADERREGDLSGPFSSGAHPIFARLAVPEDVLQHHDRVVDHDAHRQTERQQGEGVEA
jgi:hypothetical protein